jgi:hypothetical protein
MNYPRRRPPKAETVSGRRRAYLRYRLGSLGTLGKVRLSRETHPYHLRSVRGGLAGRGRGSVPADSIAAGGERRERGGPALMGGVRGRKPHDRAVQVTDPGASTVKPLPGGFTSAPKKSQQQASPTGCVCRRATSAAEALENRRRPRRDLNPLPTRPTLRGLSC